MSPIRLGVGAGSRIAQMHRRLVIVVRLRLRSAVRGDLIDPPTRTVRYGPRSFAVAGPSTWKALPAPLRNNELSVVSFRRQLKTELYSRVYSH